VLILTSPEENMKEIRGTGGKFRPRTELTL
jgi:hypothetical protein